MAPRGCCFLQTENKPLHFPGLPTWEQFSKNLASTRSKEDPTYPHFRTQRSRSNSFKIWPSTSKLSPCALSRAGFFYTGNNDETICFHCGGGLKNWKDTDDPWVEHTKHFNKCYYISSTDKNPYSAEQAQKGVKAPVDSHKSVVPVSASTVEPVLKRLDGLDEFGKRLSQIRDDCNQQQPIGTTNQKGVTDASKSLLKKQPTSRQAVYPNFASIDVRLQSFQLWSSSFKLRPEVLSEAGLFYTGKADETVCFHCGGGLKNWEETDGAWIEHARHFSECEYVLNCKGSEFVLQAKNLKTSRQADENVETLTESQKSSSPLPAYEDVESFICGVLSNSSHQQPELERGMGNEKNDKRSNTKKRIPDALLCCVCYAEKRNTLFLPCKHLAVCSKCSSRLKICAVCRTPCESKIRAIIV